MRLAAPMPIIAAGFSCRDQDHRRTLQSLLSGKVPRADRHHFGLRRGLDAILPDGRAAARGMDEAASRRAPGGMALRDLQTGWQAGLGWKAACLGLVVDASYSEPDPESTAIKAAAMRGRSQTIAPIKQ